MIYSDLYTGQKQKIPTILGLLIVIFVVVFFISLTKKTAIPSKASQTEIKRTEVVNLSPIQANIYWQTQEKEVSWIIFGDNENKLTNIVFDDRDVKEKKGEYLNHYVTLKNLKPGKQYFYAIISSNKKIIRPDGSYFAFKTPLSSTSLTKLNPASGKVLQENLLPLSNAIVMISVNDETVLISTLTKENGEWLIPLNSFFDKNSLIEKKFTGKEKIRVEVLSEDGKISTIIDNLEGLANNSRTIIIGKNYNFLQNDNVLSATTEFSHKSDPQVIQIIYPQEGAFIPGRKPLIKGTALPLSEISISINSKKTYSAIVKADKSGNWSYLIPENLDLGDHIITIKTKGVDGKEILMVRKFKIVANEGLEGKVLGTASGEPTITIQPTPTTYISNTTPTSIVSPTITLLDSGIFELFPVILGLALVIIGGGVILIF